jgi:hypothetical protein
MLKNERKTAEMQAVPQEHAMGCAVACVATRLRATYSSALALFGNPENAWGRGYYCAEIAAALSGAGLAYEYAAFDPDRHSVLLETEGTIAFVAPSAIYPAGHYLVRGPSGWMNPWLNYPRMVPVEAAFQENLPGEVSFLLYER